MRRGKEENQNPTKHVGDNPEHPPRNPEESWATPASVSSAHAGSSKTRRNLRATCNLFMKNKTAFRARRTRRRTRRSTATIRPRSPRAGTNAPINHDFKLGSELLPLTDCLDSAKCANGISELRPELAAPAIENPPRAARGAASLRHARRATPPRSSSRRRRPTSSPTSSSPTLNHFPYLLHLCT